MANENGQKNLIVEEEAGLITLTAFISPYKADRNSARALLPEGEFIEKKQLSEAVDLYCAIAKKLGN